MLVPIGLQRHTLQPLSAHRDGHARMSANVLIPGRVPWVPALRADDDDIPTIAEVQKRYGARLTTLGTRRRQQEQMTAVIARAETAREPAPREWQQQPIHSRRDIDEK